MLIVHQILGWLVAMEREGDTRRRVGRIAILLTKRKYKCQNEYANYLQHPSAPNALLEGV